MNPKPRFLNQRGMTLIEVAVVLTVVGILAAVAAPTVSNALRRERARGFAHEVANQLREARNQATARGEALIVYVGESESGASPGFIRVWRTTKRMTDGTFGGGSCNGDTEGISTFDCPSDAVCMDDTCQGNPARSCRETPAMMLTDNVQTIDNVLYRAVVDEDFGGAAEGNMGIRKARSSVGSFFCISPRGTIEQFGGTAVGPYQAGTYSCSEEGYNIWVADRDVVSDWASVGSKMTCASGPADYEEVRGHVVRVMPNGEIGLRPPRRP